MCRQTAASERLWRPEWPGEVLSGVNCWHRDHDGAFAACAASRFGGRRLDFFGRPCRSYLIHATGTADITVTLSAQVLGVQPGRARQPMESRVLSRLTPNMVSKRT